MYGGSVLFFIGLAFAAGRWAMRMFNDTAEPETSATPLIARVLEGDSLVDSDEPRTTPISPSAHLAVPLHAAPHPAFTPDLPHAGHPLAAPVLVHCPHCGIALTATPQPLPFGSVCPSCSAQVAVRGDGPGRLSIVVVAEPHR